MDPSQEALQAAQANIDDAARLYNDAAAKLDEFRGGPARPPDDANGHDQGGKQWDETFKARQASWEQARSQMATANKAYADLTGKLAVEYEIKQRSAKDPNEQNMWANEAQKAHAQADLYSAQASMYTAKTQADIDNATTRANAALQRANTYAGRTQTQDQLTQAQTALANAKLPYVAPLAQSTIALHQSQIQTAAAHAGLYVAQAAKTEAQANLLIPAQADYYVARGILTQAQADQLKIIGPVKVDELEAKLGLDKARADLIRSQIGKFQLAPAQDKGLPTLTEFQPSTGQVTGVPNPSYVNPQDQSIKDTYAAIDHVQQMLQQGQITPDDANSLMANLRTSLEATSRGFTPEQYQANQQSQANFGQSILSKMQSSGQSQADQLLSAASHARGLSGLSFTPYTNAFNAMGGNVAYQKAMDLISQIRPVTDRASGLDAVSKYAGAKALLAADQQQGSSDQSQAAPPPSASPVAPQLTNTYSPPSNGGDPNSQAQVLLRSAMSGRNI